jgi:hypothetical protein
MYTFPARSGLGVGVLYRSVVEEECDLEAIVEIGTDRMHGTSMDIRS